MNLANFSIVTPTFNRNGVIDKSLKSSIAALKKGYVKEIIVVDDGSTDGTYERLSDEYANLINEKRLRLIRQPKNAGVTASKNLGARYATGDWIIFLDSDDKLICDNFKEVINLIEKNCNVSLFFFRCIDECTRSLIGDYSQPHNMSLSEFVNQGTRGECLPVYKRSSFLLNKYNEELRGCETTSYLNLLASGGVVYLSDIVLREYSFVGSDRLSRRVNILRRSRCLYSYYRYMFRFISYMTIETKLRFIIKLVFYFFAQSIFGQRVRFVNEKN